MNYYEELGIDPSASGEDIHRAHRRLTRLLHPDQQTDQAVKRLAETQMRRLNAIVDTLSDPDKRRQYDSLLNPANPPVPVGPVNNYVTTNPFKVPGPGFDWYRIWHLLPWWVWTTLGALLLTFGVVWFLAENLGSSFSNQNLAYVSATPQDTGSLAPRAVPAKPNQPPPSSSAPQNSPLTVLSASIRDVLTSRKTLKPIGAAVPQSAVKDESLAASPATRSFVPPQGAPSAPLQTARPEPLPAPPALNLNDASRSEVSHIIPRQEIGKLAPPPEVPQTQTRAVPEKPLEIARAEPHTVPQNSPARVPEPAINQASVQDALAGEWIYAPTAPEKQKAGLFPPEFIHLKLFWDQGALRGQYHARYRVDGHAYPPEVTFVLAPMQRNPRRFLWQSSNGSRGMLRINPIDSGSIKVEWRTTVFSREPSLTAGTATLVRRFTGE